MKKSGNKKHYYDRTNNLEKTNKKKNNTDVS